VYQKLTVLATVKLERMQLLQSNYKPHTLKPENLEFRLMVVLYKNFSLLNYQLMSISNRRVGGRADLRVLILVLFF
jgi:hypothetical protein